MQTTFHHLRTPRNLRSRCFNLATATLLVTTFAVLATASRLSAQDAVVYEFDPAHSSVSFRIGHFFGKVPGKFTEFSGLIRIDEANPENSSVEAEIATASIDTANTARDEHLRNEDFFHVETNPVIVFKSKSVKRTDENTADVTGDFTMNGVTKEIVLPVTFLGKLPDMFKPELSRTAWEAVVTLKRSDYGLTWNKLVEGVSAVGDTVEVTLNIEGIQKKS